MVPYGQDASIGCSILPNDKRLQDQASQSRPYERGGMIAAVLSKAYYSILGALKGTNDL